MLDFLIYLSFKDVINFFVAIGTVSLAFFAYKQIKVTKDISKKESIRIDNEIKEKRKLVMKKLLLNLKNQKSQIDSFIFYIDRFDKSKVARWIASETENVYYVYGRWEIDVEFIGSLYEFVNEQTDIIEKINKHNLDFIEFEQSLVYIRNFFNCYKKSSIEESNYMSIIDEMSELIVKRARKYSNQVKTSINELETLIKTMDPPQSPPPPQNPPIHSAS